jgi:hypothetical protein
MGRDNGVIAYSVCRRLPLLSCGRKRPLLPHGRIAALRKLGVRRVDLGRTHPFVASARSATGPVRSAPLDVAVCP